jgi:hypothetical protein
MRPSERTASRGWERRRFNLRRESSTQPFASATKYLKIGLALIAQGASIAILSGPSSALDTYMGSGNDVLLLCTYDDLKPCVVSRWNRRYDAIEQFLDTPEDMHS